MDSSDSFLHQIRDLTERITRFFSCRDLSMPILRTELTCLLKSVLSRYYPNPYHNRDHAYKVTCYVLFLTEITDLAFSATEYFALFYSAVAHDIGHSGLTSGAISKAQVHNSRGVIDSNEEYHSKRAVSILQKYKSSFTADDHDTIAEHVRRLVRRTAIGDTNEFIKNRVSNDFNYVSVLFLRCADLSEHAGELPNAVFAARCFYLETYIEFVLLPTHVPYMAGHQYMDYSTQSIPNVQRKFIQYTVLPLFSALVKLDAVYTDQLAKVNRTLDYWTEQCQDASLGYSYFQFFCGDDVVMLNRNGIIE